MLIKIKITEDHLKLIEHINFEKFKFPITDEHPVSRFGYGIDQYNLFGGGFVAEDMAMILGFQNDYIPGTEESYMGKQYPEEIRKYMFNLHEEIFNNLEYIEHLLHSHVRIGLKVGTYKCISNVKVWEFFPEEEK